MPEEVLYVLFIAMVAVIMVNIVCAINHKKAKKRIENLIETHRCLLFGHRVGFWKGIGAYEAPEKGQLYLDLEGIRLVIENGEIEGWYIP